MPFCVSGSWRQFQLMQTPHSFLFLLPPLRWRVLPDRHQQRCHSFRPASCRTRTCLTSGNETRISRLVPRRPLPQNLQKRSRCVSSSLVASSRSFRSTLRTAAMKTVILAAGYGTRLARDLKASGQHQHLEGVAKPLLPIAGKPLISHWIDELQACPETRGEVHVVVGS